MPNFLHRPTKVRGAAARLGRVAAGVGLRGVLRQNSERYVRRRVDSPVRGVRSDLGLATDDGPHDGYEQRVCFRDVYIARCRPTSRPKGEYETGSICPFL